MATLQLKVVEGMVAQQAWVCLELQDKHRSIRLCQSVASYLLRRPISRTLVPRDQRSEERRDENVSTGSEVLM